MFIHQPEVPSPLLVGFPFPAYAMRLREVQTSGRGDSQEQSQASIGLAKYEVLFLFNHMNILQRGA
jgi:hypothetical protein